LLGLLNTAFSRLIFRVVARLHRDVEELSRVVASQNTQLRALNEANLALSQERLVSTVLQKVVDLSRELVQARYAALAVLGDKKEIKTFLTSGVDEETRKAIGPLPLGKGLLGLILERTEPLRLAQIASYPGSVGFPAGHPPMTSFLGTPIRYKEEVVGSLYLTEKVGGVPFTRSDEEVVQLFGNQAAVAIQNARLYEQIQTLAVETERTRLSREMHDGLAQVLGYVNTKAQAVEAFLAKGDVATAQEQVRELSQAARQVYQDVREGILALRSQLGPGRDLQGVLRDYISEYELILHRPVKVQWQLGQQELALTSLQEVQILRIVQEALNNVRKHAEATEVLIQFTDRGGALEVQIRDNGKGFNPLAIKRGEWPHLGLQTMQERAEAIGGVFELDSSPGKGTVVRVRLPHAIGPRAPGATP
jgi:nitrate/nitrite-specific signal transduction histidine kinase